MSHSGVSVGICIPAHDVVPATFAFDLARMMALTAGNFLAEGSLSHLSIHSAIGTIIPRARQQLAEEQAAGPNDYSLWLDSDMRFPKELLIQLLMRSETMHPIDGHVYPIYGCNYPKRGNPPDYVALKEIATADGPGQRLITNDESTGCEEVEAMGFGAVLIHNSVFRKMAEEQPDEPWFQFGFDTEIQSWVGEDVYFFRLARELGFPAMVDHEISTMLKHTGQFEYHLGHSQDYYEAQDAIGDGLPDAPELDGEVPEQG